MTEMPTTTTVRRRMAKIARILEQGPSYSFEFGPPRTPEATAQFWDTLDDLRSLSPSFVSVTYGAGGSTRDATHDIVVRINREMGVTAMAQPHVRRAHGPRSKNSWRDYREDGVENILALGGDAPVGTTARPASSRTPPISWTSCRDRRLLGGCGRGSGAAPAIGEHRGRPCAHRGEAAEADFAVTQFFFEARPTTSTSSNRCASSACTSRSSRASCRPRA